MRSSQPSSSNEFERIFIEEFQTQAQNAHHLSFGHTSFAYGYSNWLISSGISTAVSTVGGVLSILAGVGIITGLIASGVGIGLGVLGAAAVAGYGIYVYKKRKKENQSIGDWLDQQNIARDLPLIASAAATLHAKQLANATPATVRNLAVQSAKNVFTTLIKRKPPQLTSFLDLSLLKIIIGLPRSEKKPPTYATTSAWRKPHHYINLLRRRSFISERQNNSSYSAKQDETTALCPNKYRRQ